MIFMKRSLVQLEAFTTNEHLAKYFAIQKSTNFYPQFWKSIAKATRDENDMYDRPTIKTCTGLLDFFQDSFTIPLWSDLAIKVEADKYAWQFSQTNCSAVHHDNQQRIGYLEKYHHLKLISPWMLRCNSDIKFAFTEDTWNITDETAPIRVLNGVVDYKYQHGTNVNIMVPSAPASYLLQCGQPIANLRPLTEKKVKLTVHVVSEGEYGKFQDTQRNYFFVKKYIKNKEFMDKCPFHKG
jgi:hypothetical protein